MGSFWVNTLHRLACPFLVKAWKTFRLRPLGLQTVEGRSSERGGVTSNERLAEQTRLDDRVGRSSGIDEVEEKWVDCDGTYWNKFVLNVMLYGKYSTQFYHDGVISKH